MRIVECPCCGQEINDDFQSAVWSEYYQGKICEQCHEGLKEMTGEEDE